MPETARHTDAAIQIRHLDCGMPLLVEAMPSVRTAAVTWMVPVGHATDPEGEAGDGWSGLLAELVQRGAGSLDSKGFSDALDRAGVQRSVSAASVHLVVSGMTVGARLDDALRLFTDLIVRPRLPHDSMEAVRSLAIQQLEGLRDDPQHRVSINLRERHLPPPFNRSGYGCRAALESAGIEALQADWARRARPRGSILAVAGAVDADLLARRMDSLLAGWEGEATDAEVLRDPVGGVHHEQDGSNQTHVAIGLPAPSERESESLLCRLATLVLGGESSSRLFTEVRERRGLCYAVNAGYAGGRDRGMVAIYAGSTPERAQETLDTIAAELERFEGGVDADEFKRAKVGLKSRLVMQGESTSARAAAIGSDWYRLGRCRSLQALSDEVDAVGLDDLNAWIARSMGADWRRSGTLCTIGQSALNAPFGS